MKILLINPSYKYQTPWLQVTEPLGILYLASYIQRYSDYEVNILDNLANKKIKKQAPRQYWYGLTDEEMLLQVGEYNPDVVGLTCNFSRKKNDFYAAARCIRQKYPQKILVAGGTYPSLFPDEVIRSGLFDYCVLGEGEASFLQLLDFISGKEIKKTAIDGLCWQENGQTLKSPKTAYIDDLDSVPFPARDLIDYESYITRKSILHGLGFGRAASILTSRSCPNRCNFCSMFEVHGPRWRGRSAQNVVDEIVLLKEKYNIQDLFIMDDNFTIQRDRVFEICEQLISRKIKMRWNTPNGIAINTLDHKLLKAMKTAGCESICIAVESGDEYLRNKVIGKHVADKKIVEVANAAADLGLMTTAFYIIGMPGETEERFQKTIHQIKTLPFNGVAAAFANPLPGTKLYDDCQKNNYTILRTDEDEGDNVFYRPFIVMEDFSEDDLIRREKQFYRTFMRYGFFRIIRDTLLFKNKLLYPPFLLRILKDRIIRD